MRWLLAKNNTYKAGKIIRKAAVVNGVVLSDEILHVFEMAPQSTNEKQKESQIGVEVPDKQSIWKTSKSMLKSGPMVLRVLFLIYIW